MFKTDNPLSILNYYKHNKKKFLSMYATCMIGVFVLYFMQVILSSSVINVKKGNVDILRNFSVVSARTHGLFEHNVEKIRSLDSSDGTFACNHMMTFYSSAAGFSTGIHIFEMYPKDIEKVMKRLNVKITKGRMVSDYGNEIIMNEQLARNKGLTVGDSFGSMDNPQEYINTSKRIVGLFDGNYLSAFESIKDETLSNPSIAAFEYGCLVLPKNNDISTLNKDLKNFNDTVVTPSNAYDFITYESANKEFSTFSKVYGTTFYILYFFIIILTCIGLSFLSYIYYSSRMTEFATLNAIGFTKQELLKKSFLEITVINMLAFVSGVLLAIIASALANKFHYAPIGQDLYYFSSEPFIHAACCPVFVILFSIIPLWMLFRKLDPIKIIEGEY